MAAKHVPADLRRTIRDQASEVCEYCRSQERFSPQRFSVEHIKLEELKRDAGQWIRLAASREPVIITDGGKPVATLTGL